MSQTSKPPQLDQIFLWDYDLVEDDASALSGTSGGPNYDLYDTASIPYPGDLKDVPLLEAGFKIASYAVIMTLALLGNVLVIIIVCRSKRMHTTTNYYLVNLAISDLAVTLSCSWVHLVTDLTEGWTLGAFFCKFNSFVQVVSLVSSILTLTLIACDRFFGIVFALKARLTERRSWTFILLVWIASLAVSAPLLFYRTQSVRRWADHTEVWCGDSWPYVEMVDPSTGHVTFEFRSRTTYYVLLSFVLYWIPMFVLTMAYSAIVYKLWAHKAPGEELAEASIRVKVKKKVIQMLMVILFAFLLCWLPFQISILYPIFRRNKHLPLPSWYNDYQYFSTCLAYSNSALNPIIYTCFNDNFRRGFVDICWLCRRRPQRMSERSFYSYKNTIQLKSDAELSLKQTALV